MDSSFPKSRLASGKQKFQKEGVFWRALLADFFKTGRTGLKLGVFVLLT